MTGKIRVVGIGPGSADLLTPAAKKAIGEADLIIGYKTYISLIEDLTGGKEVISNGMRKEADRCRQALDKALSGRSVALISSGDPGIYGMAGLMIEIAAGSPVPIDIVPGVTAASGAAALLGAPMMHDFAVISLSDLLTDLDMIEKRIEYAAKCDFVICLYNPMSKSRKKPFMRCYDILMDNLKPCTPAGIVRNGYRVEQEVIITTLNELTDHPVDMLSIIIIGNSTTKILGGKMVTPRGYLF